jgi:hypothetical protein
MLTGKCRRTPRGVVGHDTLGSLPMSTFASAVEVFVFKISWYQYNLKYYPCSISYFEISVSDFLHPVLTMKEIEIINHNVISAAHCVLTAWKIIFLTS